MATQTTDPLARPTSQQRPSATAKRGEANWKLGWLTAGVAVATGIVGLFITIGADARWLAALGHTIVSRGQVPTGVPFATASTAHWTNSLVLAELVFNGLESALGDRGLALANLVAIGAGLSLLARDARAQGAQPSAVATTLLLVSLAAFPMLAIARVQMFSLVLFPALVSLLRAEHRQPSARIWLALPLLALWSNLHGAALAGMAVLYGYLALSRFRSQRLTALGVAAGALVALCVTPAGLDTVSYYHGLLTNVAAQQGVGQWAPLGQSPFDLVMVAIILVLAARLRHRVPALWEIVVLVGLAVLTVKAARDGVWLLFFLAAPAARASGSAERSDRLVPALLVLGLLLVVVDVVKSPQPSGASHRLVERTIAIAGETPVLADGLPSEQIAMGGGRIWAGNPLDAFSHRVQIEYVDFIQGRRDGEAALSAPGVRYVLVTRGSSAAKLTARDRGYTPVASDRTAVLYGRRR